MAWRDTRDQYGAMSIALHWFNAILVITLLIIGFIVWPLQRGPERSALLNLHMSLGLILLPFAIARVVWRLRHGKPVAEQRNPLLKATADVVWKVLLIAIVLQMLTGPLLVWMHGHPLGIFGIVSIPSPLPHTERMEELHRTVVEPAHQAIAIVLTSALVLHMLGALKHLLVDRDGVTQRMWKIRKSSDSARPPSTP